jgi:hypothetical protein
VSKRFEITVFQKSRGASVSGRDLPAVVACIGACLLLVGCSGGASRVHPVKIDVSSASSEAMELYDKDGDGAISGAELDAVPGIKKYISHYDRDGDKRVTRDEISTRLTDWSNQKLALLGAPLYVRLDGQPLGGATATLVPEPYLGPNVKPATGIVMDNGYVSLSHADEDLPKTSGGRPIPGVFAGTYKLEITHPNRKIPAKYNTATVLGEEVAYDINQSDDAIPINLTSR